MKAINSITNEERAEFLRKLDKSDLIVTDWEAKFIESFLQAHRWWDWFTPGRIVSTDKMWMKYGRDLGMRLPGEITAAAPVKFQEADANGCEFLVMDDSRRQAPCNEVATKCRRNGFRYCATHAEQVHRDVKRRGGVLTLLDYKPGGKQ